MEDLLNSLVITTDDVGPELHPELRPEPEPGQPRAPKHYVLIGEPGHLTVELPFGRLAVQKAAETLPHE